MLLILKLAACPHIGLFARYILQHILDFHEIAISEVDPVHDVLHVVIVRILLLQKEVFLFLSALDDAAWRDATSCAIIRHD